MAFGSNPVQQVTVSEASQGSLTFNISATKAGSLLVISITQSAGSTAAFPSSVSSTGGTATWVLPASNAQGNSPPQDWVSGANSYGCVIYALTNPGGITQVVVTMSATKTTGGVLTEWDPAGDTVTFDVGNHGGGGTASANQPDASITSNAGGNSYLIICAHRAASATVTAATAQQSPSSGWSSATTEPATTAGVGWQVFSSAQSGAHPGWTTTSSAWGSAVGSFKTTASSVVAPILLPAAMAVFSGPWVMQGRGVNPMPPPPLIPPTVNTISVSGTQAQSGSVTASLTQMAGVVFPDTAPLMLLNIWDRMGPRVAVKPPQLPPVVNTVAVTGTQAQSGTVLRTVSLTVAGTQAQSGSVVATFTPFGALSGIVIPALTPLLFMRPGGEQGPRLVVKPAQVPPSVFQVGLSGTQAQSGSTQRSVSHTVSGTQAQSGSTVRQVAHQVTGTQPQAGSVARQVGINVSGTQPQTGSVLRTIAKLLSGAQAQLGAIAKAVTRVINVSGTQAQAGTVTALFQQAKTPRADSSNATAGAATRSTSGTPGASSRGTSGTAGTGSRGTSGTAGASTRDTPGTPGSGSGRK